MSFPRARLKFKCVCCKKYTKYNVGYRTVPLCPECRGDEKMYQKYLKWLWYKDRKMYWKEFQRKGVKLNDDYG